MYECQTQANFTALMHAAENGQEECLRLLVKGEIDTEAKEDVRFLLFLSYVRGSNCFMNLGVCV
jgi:hypothetical protein